MNLCLDCHKQSGCTAAHVSRYNAQCDWCGKTTICIPCMLVEDKPAPLKQIPAETIERAQAAYPNLPVPFSIARQLIDDQFRNSQVPPLCTGLGWGGVHLERVGDMVQRLAEAVYHQGKHGITIKLEATDFPDVYDHWWIEVTKVEPPPQKEQVLVAIAGWPCCHCGKAIEPDDTDASAVVLDKKAQWDIPVAGNILLGSNKQALAALCGDCIQTSKAALYAVKSAGGEFIRVPVDDLEDIS